MNSARHLLVLAAAATALHAAPAPSPAPVNAIVTAITETRSTNTFQSRCVLSLTFTGDAVFDAASVRAIKVDQAVDNLGRDLTPRGPAPESPFPPQVSAYGGSLTGTVLLRTTSRDAGMIKVLKGEAELFSPTKADGGRVIVPDILAHPAEPVENAALKRSGIELMYLTRQSYEAKKQQLEAQARASAGQAGGLGQLASAFAGTFGNMIAQMIGHIDPRSGIAFYIADPEHCVAGIELQDASGQPLATRGTFRNGSFQEIRLQAPPPPHTRLRVYVATPEAVSWHPFELTNIALP